VANAVSLAIPTDDPALATEFLDAYNTASANTG